MKFSGTSNQDAAAMTSVINSIQVHRAEMPVAVISAIAKATNELEEAARLAADGQPDEAIAVVTLLHAEFFGVR